MRAFVVIALLIIVFLVYSSNAYGNVNLTPNTPAVQGQSSNLSFQTMLPTPTMFAQNGQVPQAGIPVTGGGECQTAYPVPVTGTVPCTNVPAVPVTGNTCASGCGYYPGYVYYPYPSIPVTGGACTNPYVVQYGDTLSRLALRCGTNLQTLIALNPHIYNPNLIFPGQALWLYAPTNGVPVTGPVIAPTPAPVQVNPIVLTPATSPLVGGGNLQVQVNNFPANTPVNIGIGRLSMGYQVVNSGITGANGVLVTNIQVPNTNNPLEQWTVVVVTTSGQLVQATSQPFTIGTSTP
jgi:LysM repeat protein